MRKTETKKRFIEEINLSDKNNLLEVTNNSLNCDSKKDLYKLNGNQKNAIAEARQQVWDGHFFTNDQENEAAEEGLKNK